MPKDSRPNKEQDYFQKKFGAFFRTNQLIFRPADNADIDLFDKPYLALVQLLQGTIQNAEYTYKGMNSTVDQFCYKPISGKVGLL